MSLAARPARFGSVRLRPREVTGDVCGTNLFQLFEYPSHVEIVSQPAGSDGITLQGQARAEQAARRGLGVQLSRALANLTPEGFDGACTRATPYPKPSFTPLLLHG